MPIVNGKNSTGAAANKRRGKNQKHAERRDFGRQAKWMDANALFYGTFDKSDQAASAAALPAGASGDPHRQEFPRPMTKECGEGKGEPPNSENHLSPLVPRGAREEATVGGDGSVQMPFTGHLPFSRLPPSALLAIVVLS
ncbi:MAG: hypothetical protein NT154_33880 [Verrucomicrobia bacterium]|nr:hypothetical protein [Verrucomicrobiota bacterium]